MTSPFSVDSLAMVTPETTKDTEQFLLIRRAFVEAHWRPLYLADKGITTTLLIVLLSLCGGYDHEGAAARLNRIRRLAGVDENSILSVARNRLHRKGIVLKLPSIRRGTWRFKDGGRVLTKPDERGRFVFPTRLVHKEDWAVLSAEARAALVVLASIAKPVWNASDIPDDTWIHGDGVRSPFVNNTGELNFAMLAAATGIDESHCEDAVEELGDFGFVDVNGPDFWLPDDVWYLGYAAQTKKFLRRRTARIESMLPLDIASDAHSDWH